MFISNIYTRSGRLYIARNKRIGGKLGVARALRGYFVGYSYSKFLQPCYKVVARYSGGTFGRVRHTKDVIFDMNVNFHSVDHNDLPSEQEFNNIPTLELVADADNADAFDVSSSFLLHFQLLLQPTYRIRSHLQIPTLTSRPSLKLPILTMKSEALTTR